MQKHKEWLRFAQGDLKIAITILALEEDEILIGGILYHCQQCVEKALKAYLAYQEKEIIRTHDLVALTNACGQLDEDFFKLLSDVTDLNPFSTKVRYPEARFTMPSTSFAQWAVKQTAVIFEFVQNKMA